MKSIYFAVIVLMLIAGCRQERESSNLELEYQKAMDLYCGDNPYIADKAIVALLRSIETARKDVAAKRPFDLDKISGSLWLKLFALRQQHNPQKADEALEKSVRFFDLEPQVAADPQYRRDKRAALIRFLEESEASNAPLWKRPRK